MEGGDSSDRLDDRESLPIQYRYVVFHPDGTQTYVTKHPYAETPMREDSLGEKTPVDEYAMGDSEGSFEVTDDERDARDYFLEHVVYTAESFEDLVVEPAHIQEIQDVDSLIRWAAAIMHRGGAADKESVNLMGRLVAECELGETDRLDALVIQTMAHVDSLPDVKEIFTAGPMFVADMHVVALFAESTENSDWSSWFTEFRRKRLIKSSGPDAVCPNLTSLSEDKKRLSEILLILSTQLTAKKTKMV